MAVPLSGYSASNFAGAALKPSLTREERHTAWQRNWRYLPHADVGRGALAAHAAPVLPVI